MVDLSATFLDMAGAPVPAGFDGVSVLPYVRAAPPAPRIATFVEYVGEGGGGGPPRICPATHADNNVMCNNAGNYSEPPYFFGDDFCLCQDSTNNTYSCIRVVAGVSAAAEKATMLDADGVRAPAAPGAQDFRYCEFTDAAREVEFFDFTTDPYELTNTAAALSAARRAALAARLAALRACHGSAECAPLLTAPIA
jgi:arylsulfatase A-like enzyme